MQETTFAGRVEHGRLPLSVRHGISRALRTAEGEQIEVVIRPLKLTRSQRANRYYWMCLGVIASETGHRKDELHEFFKDEFLTPKVIRLEDDAGGAIERKIHPSTTRLKSDEFTDYLRRVKEFALHRLNIVLPEPEELAA